MQQVRTYQSDDVFRLVANFVMQHICFDTTLSILHVGGNLKINLTFLSFPGYWFC